MNIIITFILEEGEVKDLLDESKFTLILELTTQN